MKSRKECKKLISRQLHTTGVIDSGGNMTNIKSSKAKKWIQIINNQANKTKKEQCRRDIQNTNVVTLGRRIVGVCEQSDGTVAGVSSGLMMTGASLPPWAPSNSFRCDIPLEMNRFSQKNVN